MTKSAIKMRIDSNWSLILMRKNNSSFTSFNLFFFFIKIPLYLLWFYWELPEEELDDEELLLLLLLLLYCSVSFRGFRYRDLSLLAITIKLPDWTISSAAGAILRTLSCPKLKYNSYQCPSLPHALHLSSFLTLLGGCYLLSFCLPDSSTASLSLLKWVSLSY